MACSRQLRASMSGPYGLDFPAVLAYAAALGLQSTDLLADCLPDVEAIILNALSKRE